MKTTHTKYQEYLDSDEAFTYALRIQFEWHQEKFEEMISLVKGTIDEFRTEKVIPKSIVHFFVRDIDFIIGTTSKDIFFNFVPDKYAKEQYLEMVKSGQEELLNLRKEFLAGDWN